MGHNLMPGAMNACCGWKEATTQRLCAEIKVSFMVRIHAFQCTQSAQLHSRNTWEGWCCCPETIFYQSLTPSLRWQCSSASVQVSQRLPTVSTLGEASRHCESFRQASPCICKAPTPYLCKVNVLKLKMYKELGILKTKSNLTCNHYT